MLAFLRKWYILAVLLCWSGAVGIVWVMPPFDAHPCFGSPDADPVSFRRDLLATGGFQETTPRMAISIYLVFLVPTGLYMCSADLIDNRNNGWANEEWMNTKVWLSIALEGGLVLSPVVLGFSLFTFFYNRFVCRAWR